MSEIRICQFLELLTADKQRHRYQNYFIANNRRYKGKVFSFAPFRAEGSLASLNGENKPLRVLFPCLPEVVTLVEAGAGNRQSVLTLSTAWLDATGRVLTAIDNFFIGTGASFSDETVELRFRSSMDSVGVNFPARTLNEENVGVLPLSSELYLR